MASTCLFNKKTFQMPRVKFNRRKLLTSSVQYHVPVPRAAASPHMISENPYSSGKLGIKIEKLKFTEVKYWPKVTQQNLDLKFHQSGPKASIIFTALFCPYPTSRTVVTWTMPGLLTEDCEWLTIWTIWPYDQYDHIDQWTKLTIWPMMDHWSIWRVMVTTNVL